MTEIVWQFSEIEAKIADMKATQTAISGLLDEEKALVAQAASVWGGAGSEAYQAVQQRWDKDAAELNAAGLNLITTVQECNMTMSQTDGDIFKMFE